MRRLAAAVALLTAFAIGQQTLVPRNAMHGDIIADKDGLVLPAGEFSVIELIEATASYLNRNYLYDHGLVALADGFVLQRRLAVDALGAEELLYALLAARRFAVFPVDELRAVYGVVALESTGRPGARRDLEQPFLAAPWRSPEQILRRPQLQEIVITYVPMASGAAGEIADMLRHAVTPRGWRPGQLLAAAGDEHMLMLHGFRPQVADALRLTERIDRVALPRRQTLLQRLAALERRLAELEQR